MSEVKQTLTPDEESRLKAAYERLELTESVSNEELNRRFDLLLKRKRSSSHAAGDGGESSLEEEIRSVKYILDMRTELELREAEQKRLAKWGKMSGTVGRIEDFVRIHRGKIIAAIILLAVLIVGTVELKQYLEKKRYEASLPPVDIHMMFLGNYGVNDPDGRTAEVEQSLLEAIPEWKRVSVEVVYLPPAGGNGTMDMAYMQKAIAELSAGRPDILVLDQNSFEWLSSQDNLTDLSEAGYEEILSAAKEQGEIVEATNAETGTTKPYGIDFTDDKLGASLPIGHDQYIAAAIPNSKHAEQAKRFLLEAAAGK